MKKTSTTILGLLPGFNCGACGYKDCYGFSKSLEEKQEDIHKCTMLNQERFKQNRVKLENLIRVGEENINDKPVGLVDRAVADFALAPLPGESSCRETLVSFSTVIVAKGDVIRYRPLGCPIIHFATVIKVQDGLLDVWITGPEKSLDGSAKYLDVGICMVLSFQGTVKGTMPEVGQTVKFLPKHCMMGKVHSGIVVSLEDEKVRIDCIDLKIWEHTNSK